MMDGRPNPYSPPVQANTFTAGVSRTSGFAARVLSIVVLLVSGLHVFRGSLYFGALAYAELTRAVPVVHALDVTWAAARALTVLAAVAFALWIHRANRDARSMGARGMLFTPGWSVATTFLPLVNLVAPFRAVREIYQASHPVLGSHGEKWKAAPVTPILGLWWALALTSLGWLSLSGLLPAPGAAAYRQPVLEMLLAAAGICFAAVVRRINSRLEERAAGPAALDTKSCLA